MCVVFGAGKVLFVNYCLHGRDRLAQNPLAGILEEGAVSMVGIQNDWSLGTPQKHIAV